jgi:hypothetical protein
VARRAAQSRHRPSTVRHPSAGFPIAGRYPSSFLSTYQNSCSCVSLRPRPSFAGQRAAAAGTDCRRRGCSPEPPPPVQPAKPSEGDHRPFHRPSRRNSSEPRRNCAQPAPAGRPRGHIAKENFFSRVFLQSGNSNSKVIFLFF